MTKIRAAVVGYGNIGKFTIQALEAAPDMEIAGVVRRNLGEKPLELTPYPIVTDIRELGHVDVAILCTPTREVEKYALEFLALGINTVDSFDIHTQITALRRSLNEAAVKAGKVSVISAGWDPGSDSIIRTLLEAAAPKGITYTNFGPGMSMGHTVCVKSKPGVKNALSMTMPKVTECTAVWCMMETPARSNSRRGSQSCKGGPLFCFRRNTRYGSGERGCSKGYGATVCIWCARVFSGQTQNQRFEFTMSINNPALTAQLLVAVARAAMRLAPGAYTMVEIPVIDLLPGDRESLIAHLV